MIHALAGVANAQANCWPLLLLSAGCERSLSHKGGFQETPQLPAIAPYVKYGARVEAIERAPFRTLLSRLRCKRACLQTHKCLTKTRRVPFDQMTQSPYTDTPLTRLQTLNAPSAPPSPGDAAQPTSRFPYATLPPTRTNASPQADFFTAECDAAVRCSSSSLCASPSPPCSLSRSPL